MTTRASSRLKTPGSAKPTTPAKVAKKRRSPATTDSADAPAAQENVTAFLRIRPSPTDVDLASPYLLALSDCVVQLSPITESSKSRFGSNPAKFTFSHVFSPDTTQKDFFRHTTLPLVSNVLEGQNALLFAYGVTNSGKTYSIQGGREESTAGILPRTFDLIFESIEHARRSSGPVDAPSEVDGELPYIPISPEKQYSIQISYAEIYNERVFDLLDQSAATSNAIASSSDAMKTISLRRKALALKTHPDGSKYISGLKEFSVSGAAEAKKLLQQGQTNRRVFGTLANLVSSRSHAVFTIKVTSAQGRSHAKTTKLCIVDLAGSERSKNTQATGDRLREAGNINKSLMVLGQCLEALRTNQQRQLQTAQKPVIVPFRHSKLTELFQDFFTGQGRVSMIVNVNPYDTGLDENLRVMEFSSLAKEIKLKSPGSLPNNQKRRTFKLSLACLPGINEAAETTVEVVEDDAEDEEDEPPLNPLVDALFDEVESLRKRLHQSEMKVAMIEADVREEMFREMEKRMQEMEELYAARLSSEAEYNERKTNRKLDLLYGGEVHRKGKMKVESEDEDETTFRSAEDVGSLKVKSAQPVRADVQKGDLGLFLEEEDSASETDCSDRGSVDVDEDEDIDEDEEGESGVEASGESYADRSYHEQSSSAGTSSFAVSDEPRSLSEQSSPGYSGRMPGRYSGNSSLSDDFDNLSLKPIDTPGTPWKKKRVVA